MTSDLNRLRAEIGEAALAAHPDYPDGEMVHKDEAAVDIIADILHAVYGVCPLVSFVNAPEQAALLDRALNAWVHDTEDEDVEP